MKPTKRITVVDGPESEALKPLKAALISLNANQMEALARVVLKGSGVEFSRTQQSLVANSHFRLGFIAGMLVTVGLNKDVHSALLSDNPAVREIGRIIATLDFSKVEPEKT
jgi:hypothetical protein